MIVRRLVLTNFRCYRHLDLELAPGPTVIVGANAQGKTTLLEAATIAATTRSPIASTERELVRWKAGVDDGLAYAQIRAEVDRTDGPRRIDVVYSLAADDIGAAPDDRRVSKRLRVDGVARRGADVLGQLLVVLFTPRDLALVDGPPSERRRYLDVLLCQINRRYCDALTRYNKVLTQRNHLLRQLRDGRGSADELEFWDDRLAKDAGVILWRRAQATTELQSLAATIHDDLVGGGPPLALHYESTAAEAIGEGSFPAEDPAAAEQLMRRALRSARREERARGMTVVGPHRDDIGFAIEGISMRTYGSRGQQRSVALATKLAEAALMRAETDEVPVLLLDDVMSELDPERRRYLTERIADGGQTLITATELEPLEPNFVRAADVVRISAGTAEPEQQSEAA